MLSISRVRRTFKFVQSRARHYIRCPYFLYLSNYKEIYVPYSQIASQRGSFFERSVLASISQKTGYDIVRVKQGTDLLIGTGLYAFNKQVNTEFYANGSIALGVGTLKPDIILSEISGNSAEITIMEIKNSEELKPIITYKLTSTSWPWRNICQR